jgi:hypothetical protein
MLMAKIDEVEYLCFYHPKGFIELRDQHFVSYSFNANQGTVLIKDILAKINTWKSVPVATFKRMVKTQMDQNLHGLAQLVS